MLYFHISDIFYFHKRKVPRTDDLSWINFPNPVGTTLNSAIVSHSHITVKLPH